MFKRILVVLAGIMSMMLLSSCALFDAGVSDLNAALKGRSGVMQTYDQYGAIIDSVQAASFYVVQDTQFNSVSTSSKGTITNKDSQVLLITVGGKEIRHVGSSLVFAQTGVNEVFRAGGGTVKFQNSDPSVPFLNTFFIQNRNLWRGSAKTLFIRSQNGSPIAIYAGNHVEVYATDIPKTTFFQIDGLQLFVYQVDYTVYDNALIGG